MDKKSSVKFGAFRKHAPTPVAMKKGGAVKKCVEGGEIDGPGGPTDDLVPIMASNGEFMIKASSAKILGGDLLEALNDLGGEPKNPKDDAAEDAKEGESEMKRGGMVRKPVLHMAAGGDVEDEQRRAESLAKIPTAESKAPAPDGRSGENDFTRNINNGLNALGGMGVVASVPLKSAQAAQGAVRPAMNALPVLTSSIPRLGAPVAQAAPDFIAGASGVAKAGASNLPAAITNTQIPIAKTVNVALQEGAQANQMASATRSAAGVNTVQGQLVDNQPPKAAGALPVNPAAPPANPAQPGTPAAQPVINPQGAVPPVAPQPSAPTTVLGPDGRQYINETVSAGDSAKSDAMLNTVFGRRGNADQNQSMRAAALNNGVADPSEWKTPQGGGVMANSDADMNINKLRSNSGALDTANKAWAMAGRGIQASRDANGGLVLSNSTAPEKMAYVDTTGKPTTEYKNTNQYAQGVAATEKAQSAEELNAFGKSMTDKSREALVTLLNSRRGAGAVRQASQLAQDKFALESTGTKLDNEQKTNAVAFEKIRQDLYGKYLNGTPAEKAQAAEQLNMLNGKQSKENFTVVPDFDGNGVRVGTTVLDGQGRTIDIKGGQKANATPKADYDKLPAGSVYTGQDGKQYKKG